MNKSQAKDEATAILEDAEHHLSRLEGHLKEFRTRAIRLRTQPSPEKELYPLAFCDMVLRQTARLHHSLEQANNAYENSLP